MRREINQSELSFFYQKIGEAIWHFQHVEDLLINLHFIKHHAKTLGGISETEAYSVLHELQKLALGRLIGRAEKLETISSDFANKLRSFNETRIWIVHHSMREDGEKLYTSTGRNEFIYRVRAFTDKAMEIQKDIEHQVLDYSEAQGISKQKAYEIANQHIAELKGEA